MFVGSRHNRFFAGKGGNGRSVHGVEKYIPKGGPSGGNGGKGAAMSIFISGRAKFILWIGSQSPHIKSR